MAITGICNLRGLLPARIQKLSIKRNDYILLLAIGALTAADSVHMAHIQKDISSPELNVLRFQTIDLGQTLSLESYRTQGESNPQRPVSGSKHSKPVATPADEPFDYNHMGCNLLSAIISTVTGVIFEDYVGTGLAQSPKPNHAPNDISGEKFRAAGYSHLTSY